MQFPPIRLGPRLPNGIWQHDLPMNSLKAFFATALLAFGIVTGAALPDSIPGLMPGDVPAGKPAANAAVRRGCISGLSQGKSGPIFLGRCANQHRLQANA